MSKLRSVSPRPVEHRAESPSGNDSTPRRPRPELHVVSPQPRPAAASVEPTAAPAAEALRAEGIRKSFRMGKLKIPVLRGVDFSVRRGEFAAIVGQSGSGKSTLLHILATLDAPDRGALFFGGQRIDHVAARLRDRLRNERFGMIFQFYHLLPELTTIENVLAPLMIGNGIWRYWRQRRAFRRRAEHLLELVGLAHRLRHKPYELSGGEMQRVAIARSLINRPQLLLADEPTGNLDQQNGHEILQILRSLNRDENLTIVMVTHDLSIAKQAHRTVRLSEGQVTTSCATDGGPAGARAN